MKNKIILFLIIFSFLVFTFFFVKGAAIFGSGTVYNTSEQGGNNPYFFNFTKNITLGDYEEVVAYAIDDSQESEYIMLNNILLEPEDISSWIVMNNSSGILEINSTKDDETGLLLLPLAVTVQSDVGSDTLRRMYNYTIYALNDILYFTNLRPDYTYIFPTNESTFESYNITIGDEEEHYPLNYTIEFTDCTYAFWLDKVDGEDCQLFNLTNLTEDNTSLFLDYTPNNLDVGIYNLTISVQEAEHMCPHNYCLEGYEERHIISQDIIIQVLSQLEVDVSDCYNNVFVEGQYDSCNIIIKTRDPIGDLKLNSSASFARFSGIPSDKDWFYSYNDSYSSSNFYKEIEVAFIPEKKHIGNWSIDFEVYDNTTDERNITKIPLVVQRNPLLNSVPNISDIDSVYTSTGKEESVLFRIYDDDLLIEDRLDGYDEEFEISYQVINQTNLEDVSSLFEDFVEINIIYPYQVQFNQFSYLSSFLTGNVISNFGETENIFSKIILFFKNFFKNNFLTGYFGFSTFEGEDIKNYSIVIFNITSDYYHAGNYTINLNISDKQNAYDLSSFDLEIFTNQPPTWNQSSYQFNLVVNSSIETTTDKILNLDLKNNYVSDLDTSVENLVFSYDSLRAPSSFNVSSLGIVNFIPYKTDVGYYEFNVTANDGFLQKNSLWKINVSNLNSPPEIDIISEGYFKINQGLWNSSSNIIMLQNNNLSFNFKVYDDDILINNLIYLEELNYNVTIINKTEVYEPINLVFSRMSFSDFNRFTTQIKPGFVNVGEYTVIFNVSDKQNSFDTFEFNLTIIEVNSAPIINNLENRTTTILDNLFYLDINATDQEDDIRGINLNYSLTPLEIDSPPLNLDNRTGLINFDFNKNNNYTGIWNYNISVQDSFGAITSELFELTVHGLFNISYPNESEIFRLKENENKSLNFSLDYPIDLTNFSYKFYLDGIESFYDNGTLNFNYTNFSLRNNGSFLYNQSNDGNFSFVIKPNFSDEGYGNLTNVSLFILNNNFPRLNYSFNWSANVSHNNSPLTFNGTIPNVGPVSVGSEVNISLRNYFSDYDYFDPYYNQNINFTLNLVEGGPGNVIFSSYFDGWNLVLKSLVNAQEVVNITGYEFNSSNLQINNVTSNSFNVTFVPPEEIEKQKDSDGRVIRDTAVKHYALKIITPGNLYVSNQDFIEFNFSVFNTGMVDLYGIDLRGLVEFNHESTGDLNISFSQDFIDVLKINESKDYTARIDMATEAVGRYDITLFGDVTTPKFSDWSTFYVEIQGLDESELSQLILFTEKFVSENPECLELTELLFQAQESFSKGDLIDSEKLTRQVINACEESISVNEQIRWRDNEVPLSKSFLIFFIVSLILLIVFLIFNYYNKIKFKKSKSDEYI